MNNKYFCTNRATKHMKIITTTRRRKIRGSRRRSGSPPDFNHPFFTHLSQTFHQNPFKTFSVMLLTLCSTTPTHGAGPLGHPRDEPLLFAGCLSPVALVLVGVSVGTAHGYVVFVALKIKSQRQLGDDGNPSDLLGLVCRSRRSMLIFWICTICMFSSWFRQNTPTVEETRRHGEG